MKNSRKKILFLITQGEMGGAQVYVRDLATSLNKNEFDITVSHGEKQAEWLTQQAVDNDLKFKHFKYVKRRINPIYEIIGFLEVYNFLRQEKFDIVHLNSSKIGILGSLAAKLAGIKKIIFTCHGWAFDDPRPWWERLLYIVMYRIMSWFIDKIICVSEYAKQAGINKSLNKNKLTTIHNGLNLEKINLLNKSDARNLLATNYQLPTTHYLIGTIANFYPTKGLIYLLQAAKKIFYTPDKGSQKDLNFKNTFFCIIGKGQQEKTLRNFIAKNNLSKNIFLITNLADAARVLPAFDLFVLPSVKECLPYVLFEAINAGLPIVSTKVGGTPEVLAKYDSDYYKLVESKNPSALAQGILEMINKDKITNDKLIEIRNTINLDEMLALTRQIYLN